jgi:hypothetical protein
MQSCVRRRRTGYGVINNSLIGGFEKYSFKLMLTIDIAEIMRTILFELNDKLHAKHAVAGVCLF